MDRLKRLAHVAPRTVAVLSQRDDDPDYAITPENLRRWDREGRAAVREWRRGLTEYVVRFGPRSGSPEEDVLWQAFDNLSRLGSVDGLRREVDRLYLRTDEPVREGVATHVIDAVDYLGGWFEESSIYDVQGLRVPDVKRLAEILSQLTGLRTEVNASAIAVFGDGASDVGIAQRLRREARRIVATAKVQRRGAGAGRKVTLTWQPNGLGSYFSRGWFGEFWITRVSGPEKRYRLQWANLKGLPPGRSGFWHEIGPLFRSPGEAKAAARHYVEAHLLSFAPSGTV